MARKKITPEEETPKTVAPEESAAADVGDMTQNDLPPGESGTAEGRGAEAVPAMEATEDADGTRAATRQRRAGKKTLRRLPRRKCLRQIFLPRRKRNLRPWKNNL